MYYTNVTELCKAIQHIEENDLKRILKKKGGKISFPTGKEPYIECYTEIDGPASDMLEKVTLTKDNGITLHFASIGEQKPEAVYPGHLSAISEAIIKMES